ncbi:AIPR family protein [Bacillus sp. Cr_A10]|uniref:AIPR family protein n=1 Tax=Bacillus sp. Cr_A10 TaxID=3033993 RepID=UPI0023DC27CC|nr:AIPR family protein [Bacillus sp. Cr_A10]MDF2064965.1 AIPR family protein [Bacillus sp. Cr_A10]
MVTKKDLSKCTVFEFKVDSVRLISDNKGTEEEQLHAIMRVDVQDVPEGIWMETNLRERNFKTTVAKNIRTSLIESPSDNFHVLNRGILISAHHIEIVEKPDGKYVRVYLLHKGLHGNVDGGHTLNIIVDNKESIIFKKRVTIEVLTGIESFFEELAAARNTSVHVEDKSKLELEKKFEFIKNAISGKRYASDIAYKENQEGSIDITDIIAILSMFNLDRYPNKKGDQNFPTAAYARKSACTKWYSEDYLKGNSNPYKKMEGIITDILSLVDAVQSGLPKFYNASAPNAKYGRTSGVAVAKEGNQGFKRLYADDVAYLEHSTPNGFIYPVVGAFRYLIKEVDGKYVWKTDPFAILEEIGTSLAITVIEAHRGLGNNPNATGKFINLWSSLYNIVKLAYLEKVED